MKHALDRSHGRLHGGIFCTEFPNRHKELLQILDKGHQRSQGDQALANLARAIPQHERNRDDAQRLNNGEQTGLIDIREMVGVAVGAIALLKLGKHFSFLGKHLHDHNPGQGFLQKGINPRQAFPDGPIGHARPGPKKIQDEQQRGQESQRHDRQVKIDRQHNHDNAHQGQDVHEDGQGPGRERFVNGIDISSQTGDQTTDRRALKKARRQFLYVAEQVTSQIGQAVLGDQHRRLKLNVKE